jgi:beta-carotene 3-hydroxylase
MELLWYFITGFVTFMAMEGMAWFSHKYIMHGFLWNLHEDHHVHNPNKDESLFEKNDAFFVIFAVPAMLFLLFGSILSQPYFLAIGIGITCYGIVYFLFHDVFLHRRLPLLNNWNNAYLRAVRRAHRNHHKHYGKEDGECFGMLIFPIKYFIMELQQK